jgi:hypothetical protein
VQVAKREWWNADVQAMNLDFRLAAQPQRIIPQDLFCLLFLGNESYWSKGSKSLFKNYRKNPERSSCSGLSV